jgi:hypothetical protein
LILKTIATEFDCLRLLRVQHSSQHSAAAAAAAAAKMMIMWG